jgi:hypothetical protein
LIEEAMKDAQVQQLDKISQSVQVTAQEQISAIVEDAVKNAEDEVKKVVSEKVQAIAQEQIGQAVQDVEKTISRAPASDGLPIQTSEPMVPTVVELDVPVSESSTDPSFEAVANLGEETSQESLDPLDHLPANFKEAVDIAETLETPPQELAAVAPEIGPLSLEQENLSEISQPLEPTRGESLPYETQ